MEKKSKKKYILIAAACLFAAFLIFLVKFLLPVYNETSDTVYEILSDVTSADFIREGNTMIYGADGEVVGEYGYEEYEYVDITEISDYITYGYIAREDKNFTRHNGVDLLATLRAGIAYVLNGGEITQGGNTITQQLIKNSLLTQEQTFTRKITEIFLAWEIEKDYTKADIMELYCNCNYYGNSCYGVEATAQYYFGKSANDVTLAEAAILVATSNSPNNYNPVADYDLAMERKNLVLDDMLEEEHITQEEYDTAYAEEPEIIAQHTDTEDISYLVSYATHCAALRLMENEGFQFQYLFSSQDEEDSYVESYSEAYNNALEEIRSGGYEIYTSFDTSVQEALQEQVDSGLSGFTDTDDSGVYKMQSAAVCIDNETQMVVAVVGGRSGSGEYNRGYQAVRQPGSSIKPLLDYGPALDNGTASPGSVFTDKETTIDGYSPKNSDGSYRGRVTVREALIRSINTIALQVFDQSGSFDNLSYLEEMKFSSLSFADSSALAVSIGGFTNGVTVSDMVRGYAAIANGGSYSSNDCILSIETYAGETVYEASNAETQVYSEDTAFMLTDMMNGLFEESYGSGYGASDSGQNYVGKTGTTDNNYDTWFCGFSPYYTTAVWVGCDSPETLGFYGSDYPLEIWTAFMDTVHEGLDPINFEMPSTIKLMNSSGDTKDADYSGYDSRPDGYDYVSGSLQELLEENEEAREQEEIEAAAEAAVSEFEDYQIESVSDATGLESAYASAYKAVDLVADSELRAELMKRLAYKYELLSGEVTDKWLDAIAAAEEAEQDKKDSENAIKAQESLELAQQQEKETRIELVEYYVDALNNCTVYSTYVDQLCTKAENALAACSSHSEYDELSESVTAAINRAMNLPSPSSSSSSRSSSRNSSDDD